MPELSRRTLLAIAVMLALAAAVGSFRVDTGPTTSVLGARAYRGHSSPGEPETTTTTAAPTTTTTTTTALPPATTATTGVDAHAVVTTTTTVLAVVHPTTTTVVPTTPCTWSAETFPQLNGVGPTLFVHVVAPAQPNSTMTVRLFPHGSSALQATRAVGSDGTGHVNVSFPVTVAQLGSKVDLTAGARGISCSPKLYTTTLTPVL